MSDETNNLEAAANEELSQVLRDYMEVAERLQSTHRALESEVQRLRGELKQKDRELEQRRRLAALGEVAAGVAHEVRNPLGAIELYSGLLQKECEQLAPALDLIQKIQAGIRAIDSVVQNTLALAPNQVCRIQPHVFQSVIRRAAELSAAAYQRRGITLELSMPHDDVSVDCDADALQRALLNLLTNAAEASPPAGRVRLLLEAGAAGEARVRVVDDGDGLPRDFPDRVFDPFFTTKKHGTGLGLSIAYRLVEAHGGRLTARNRREGGAEFIMTLSRHGSRETDTDFKAADARQPSAA